MKKLFLAIALTFCSLLAYAPNMDILYLPVANPIHKVIKGYDALIAAIYYYESGNNPNAYNPKENAVGGLQIRECRINHYNKLTGKKYTLKEMYDFNKAKEIFLYFAEGKSYEQAAKNWNGSGPMTTTYWNNVKSILDRGFVKVPEQLNRAEVAKKEFRIERPIIREYLSKAPTSNLSPKINV